MRTDAQDLPYEDVSVTFIRWLPDHALDSCTSRQTKREWLATGEKLFAAWTGRFRSDIFEVDARAARKALKMDPPKRVKPANQSSPAQTREPAMPRTPDTRPDRWFMPSKGTRWHAKAAGADHAVCSSATRPRRAPNDAGEWGIWYQDDEWVSGSATRKCAKCELQAEAAQMLSEGGERGFVRMGQDLGLSQYAIWQLVKSTKA